MVQAQQNSGGNIGVDRTVSIFIGKEDERLTRSQDVHRGFKYSTKKVKKRFKIMRRS